MSNQAGNKNVGFSHDAAQIMYMYTNLNVNTSIISLFFFISARAINKGYSSDPPPCGGSNEHIHYSIRLRPS